jgi:hypothetical protein
VEFLSSFLGSLPGKVSFEGFEGLLCHSSSGSSSEDEGPWDEQPPEVLIHELFLPESGNFPWDKILDGRTEPFEILPRKGLKGDAYPSKEVRICLSFCHTGVW